MHGLSVPHPISAQIAGPQPLPSIRGPLVTMVAARRLARQGAGVAHTRHHSRQPVVLAVPPARAVPRGLGRPAAVCCASTNVETAAQALSAAGAATDAKAAGDGSTHHSQHSRDTDPAKVLTDEDAFAAERRASGRSASTSAGGNVEPVAVARCHTLAAQVRSSRSCTVHPRRMLSARQAALLRAAFWSMPSIAFRKVL